MSIKMIKKIKGILNKKRKEYNQIFYLSINGCLKNMNYIYELKNQVRIEVNHDA